MPTFDALLLGGGSGTRFSGGTGLPKQFVLLGNAPVLVHSAGAFLEMGARRCVIAVPSEHRETTEQILGSYFADARDRFQVVEGGETRAESSLRALEAVESHPPAPDRVLIHDACRPFLSAELRARILAKVNDAGFAAWIPTLPVTETLKRVERGRVRATVDREGVHRVQTPQIFDFPMILNLARRAQGSDLPLTDDASLCEYFGVSVGVFDGDSRNIKLTYASETGELEASLSGVKSCESELAGISTD